MTESNSTVQSAPLPLCLLIPVGPSATDVSRLSDLLEACAAYADLPLCAVVINDGNEPAALEQVGRKFGIPTTVRPNARQGKGDWWRGGLCVGMLEALLWIGGNCPCRGVLRLDLDALAINPFASQVVAILEADPLVGMVGNCDTPTGEPLSPGHELTAMLYWRSKPVSHDRKLRKIIFSIWGWRRRLRLLIQRAQRNGYVLGDWCQGGAYAVSPSFLARLVSDPALARPHDYLQVDFGEDIFMAVVVRATGLYAHYTVGPSRLFASKWKGLYDTPAALAAAGHGLIHSVKDQDNLKEADIRAFFRARRPPISQPGVTKSRLNELERPRTSPPPRGPLSVDKNANDHHATL